MGPKRAWEKSLTCRLRGPETARRCWRILITTPAAAACSTSWTTTRINRGPPRLTTSCAVRRLVLFAGPDLVALGDRQHEDASVADLARARRRDDGLDRVVHDRIGDDDFDLHLRQQADVVFLTAVDRRVALLLAVAPHL